MRSRCLPRSGEWGTATVDVREETDALDRGLLLVAALDSGAVLGRAFSCRGSWEGRGNGRGCLPRCGGLGAGAWDLRDGWEGELKREPKDEVEAWEWGRLLLGALGSGAVLGRAVSCWWRGEGLSAEMGCLPRCGGLDASSLGMRGGWMGRSKREPMEEVEALKWGCLLVRAPASGAVLGRSFCCRLRWEGLSAGMGCRASWGGEGASKGSPMKDADAIDLGGGLWRVSGSSGTPSCLFSCWSTWDGLGAGEDCLACRAGDGGSREPPTEDADVCGFVGGLWLVPA